MRLLALKVVFRTTREIQFLLGCWLVSFILCSGNFCSADFADVFVRCSVCCGTFLDFVFQHLLFSFFEYLRIATLD